MADLLNPAESKKSNTTSGISYTVLSVGILIGMCLAGLIFFQKSTPPQVDSAIQNSELAKTVLLFEEALQHISRDYIDEIRPATLAQAAIDGVFTKLDRHSKYLDESTYQNLLEQTDGQYFGVGIETEELQGLVTIVLVLAESPADQIGLRVGDQILAINGQDVVLSSYEQVLEQARTHFDTNLELTLLRDGQHFDVQLSREFIPIDSINSVHLNVHSGDRQNKTDANGRPHNGIAYIRISHFNEQTADDLARILEELAHEAKQPGGLVLDLRNNPGGLLKSAVEVSDLFLNSGTIVSANGRASDADFKFQADKSEMLSGMSLVVLINSATASAAEIVAAALKEQDRAILVGQSSYGKGLVQTIIPLQSGALKLTTSRYYTPSGLSINERGIRPHILIDDSTMLDTINELTVTDADLFQTLAIKDPALLRAWQYLDRTNNRDQIAMETQDAE